MNLALMLAIINWCEPKIVKIKPIIERLSKLSCNVNQLKIRFMQPRIHIQKKKRGKKLKAKSIIRGVEEFAAKCPQFSALFVHLSLIKEESSCKNKQMRFAQITKIGLLHL